MSEPRLIDASCDCADCVKRTTEMYDLPGRCLNCGTRFTVRSRKGDRPPLYVECPSCEVNAFSWRDDEVIFAEPTNGEPHAINEHERTCPDCQRVIREERHLYESAIEGLRL